MRDRSGQAMVEYALVLVLVAIVVVAVLVLLGDRARDGFQAIVDRVR